jgi:hypothetical protein
VIGAGNTLVVAGNNLSTVVSGRITDGCGCGPGDQARWKRSAAAD